MEQLGSYLATYYLLPQKLPHNDSSIYPSIPKEKYTDISHISTLMTKRKKVSIWVKTLKTKDILHTRTILQMIMN